MGDYRIGTSGWHYDHWKGRFYPEELRKRDWFDYYAASFPTVELNNSFYHQPSASTWQAWHEAAPPGFRFAVKANRFISHVKRFKDCEDPLQRFLDGAEELKSFLGPVLYQTPPNFHCNTQNMERLDGFLAPLPRRLRSVLEFRHDSWFTDDVLEMLRRHNVALCIQDMKGLSCPREATAGFVYVRLHGAGDETYAGNYSESALRDWAHSIESLTKASNGEAWVYFNNDQHGHAIDNARSLGDMLGVSSPA